MRESVQNHLIVLAAAFAVAGCSQFDPDARETSGEKAEWSVLQGVEYAHRGKQLSKPVVLQVHGYDVLGLRSLKGDNVWVLLKPEAPPFYKQLPEENYTIPLAFVTSLSEAGKLGYTVEAVLSSRTETNDAQPIIPSDLSRQAAPAR
ncbi:hypothetical protein O4G98_20715 [Zoogloeaceae bacterium G21618-S1]|nr:hypothetical protein [Zoogloeaceae bacterium G21618-S1]